ncbi:MAG TPA: hypothetical protein PKM50_01880 [Methanoregula sp.]|nr:hypothetical protein [Methanoregula sp.]
MFEIIKSFSFFDRIFKWGKIDKVNSVAFTEFQTISRELGELSEQNKNAQIRTDNICQNLENQKDQFFQLQREKDALKNLSENINQELRSKENELGALKEADLKNSKRIVELEKETERFRTSIEQYHAEIQEKENELGALREADSKNSKRIIELEKETEKFRTSVELYHTKIQEKENELGGLKESDNKNFKRVRELENELSIKHNENQQLIKDKIENERQLSAFKDGEKQAQEQYEHKITELNSLKKQLDDDRRRIQSEREEEIKNQFERMCATWKVHEKNVEEMIRGTCTRHQIEYINKEQTPFKGKPDNTLKIAGEYIIFDAKSPSSDDLNNFPTYIKNQTEQLKKYVKEKDVNKSLFLVIPSNTVDVIEQFYYNLAEYQVFIVSLDTLEPVILSLKKIENYEFVEQLSPEERENICRVIGKFAHATKRRVQIDSYFCGEFINILNACENLPEDILEKTQEFEKSDKMNPPLEKRAKLIASTQLKKDARRIKQEAEAQDIDVVVCDSAIETLPLYKPEQN